MRKHLESCAQVSKAARVFKFKVNWGERVVKPDNLFSRIRKPASEGDDSTDSAEFLAYCQKFGLLLLLD